MRLTFCSALLLALAGCRAGDYNLTSDPERHSVMHMPKAGCPAGFKRVRGLFIYRGKPEDGCVNGGGGSIDYLRAGESYRMEIPLPDEPAKREPGPTI